MYKDLVMYLERLEVELFASLLPVYVQHTRQVYEAEFSTYFMVRYRADYTLHTALPIYMCMYTCMSWCGTVWYVSSFIFTYVRIAYCCLFSAWVVYT